MLHTVTVEALLSTAVLVSQLVCVRAQITVVGRACTESVECGSGSFCSSNKRCTCLSSYIDISGFCWRKINPGESGCTQNRQCDAVWPNAYCSSGSCKCGNNQDPLPTVDGYVCINYGECPIGGRSVKYQENGQVLPGCLFSSFNSPIANAFGRPDVTTHTRIYSCPETYDCICSDATCSSTGSTFCCPSRNYACSLDSDTGTFPNNGAGTVTRWYHDPVTNECKQFSYRGDTGNANQFETEDHCKSYCIDTCERGRPQYESSLTGNTISGTTLFQIPLAISCDSGSTTTSCATGFTCTTRGTRNLCCPNVDSVCSQNGGIAYNALDAPGQVPTTAAPYDVGVAASTTASTSSRWYYSRADNRCRSFTWLGQAGNWNRFLTQSHCEDYCSKIVCTAGIPLKDTTGITNYNCGGSDSSCPTTHECKSSLCCPRAQFVCKLTQQAGNCANYVTRWWYNAQVGTCEEFTYSGCQGNSNNFESYTTCQSFCKDARVEPICIQGKAQSDSNANFLVCGGSRGTIQSCSANYFCFYDGNTYGCCPNQAYTCELSFDQGRECGPEVTRWYYDSSTRTCQTYTYKGCDGNSNNFATQQDCNEYCRTDNCPDGGQAFVEGNGQSRTCTADTDCPNTHFCSSISSFQNNALQVSRVCCPSKSYICALARDAGTRCSQTTISRFFFNSATRTCESFQYNGCAGNRNNFATSIQCQNYCLSSACSTGTVVSLDSGTGVLSACRNIGGRGTVSDGCPNGFTCANSQILGQNVCCGVPSGLANLCPAASSPYLSPLTLQARQCTPNVVGSCPAGYFCWYSTNAAQQNAYFCCLEATAVQNGICPPQLLAVAGTNGQQYRFCTPSPSAGVNQNAVFAGTQGSCGQNEYCQFSEVISQFVCCGSGSDLKPNVCPPQPVGLSPYFIGRDYRNCDPNALSGTQAACPSDAACLWINQEIQYICCRDPARVLPQQRRNDLRSQQVDKKIDVEVLAKHCSGQQGFRPVRIDNREASCSPMDGNSCMNYRDLGSKTACMFSAPLKKFVCCYSLWRFNDGEEYANTTDV